MATDIHLPDARSENIHLVERKSDAALSMDKRADLAVALAMTALGIAVCLLATRIRNGTFPDPVTPRGLPYLAGGFIAVGGIVLAIRRLLDWTSFSGSFVPAEGVIDEVGHPASGWRSAGAMTAALGWALCLDHLGFLIVTPVFLIIVLWIMKVRSAGRLFGLAFGFTFATWAIFAMALDVAVPLGPFEEFFRSIGATV